MSLGATCTSRRDDGGAGAGDGGGEGEGGRRAPKALTIE